MKKKLSLIVIMILFVFIVSLGYKLIVPDDGDRFEENSISSGSENNQSDVTITPEPTPSAELTVVPTPSSESSTDNENDENPKATAEPEPSSAPTASPSVVPSDAPDGSDEKTEYEKYMELSGEEQQKIFESYKKPQDFFDWFNKAKAEYDEKNQAIIVEGGSINLEEYAEKQDDKAE